MKIFHTADLHIGKTFTRYGTISTDLMEARRSGLDRLVQLANEYECDILVIAGDLFDRPKVAARDVMRAAKSLAAFEGTAVLVLPGNHDHTGLHESIWHHFTANCAPHTLLHTDASPVTIADGLPSALVFHPAPCDAKTSETHRLPSDPIQADGLHIGIAHGSVEGFTPDLQGRYFPMTVDQLQSTGIPLWLLGHTHVPFDMGMSGGGRILNPGTPEPDDITSAHPGYAFLISIEPTLGPGTAAVEVSQVPTGQYRFRRTVVEELAGPKAISTLLDVTKDVDSYTVQELAVRARVTAEEREELTRIVTDLERRAAWCSVDLSGLREQITAERINALFAEQSFEHRLLSDLMRTGDEHALQRAFELLQEARNDV